MAEWTADIPIDDSTALAVVREQFPALAARRIARLAEGWDNAAFLVDGEWLFRFPRRAVAVAGVRLEMRLLPALAARLPLPVPDAALQGVPSPAFPHPFFGYRALAGREACDAGLDDAARTALAPALGGFLRALHAPALARELGADLPVDPIGRAAMAERIPKTRARIGELCAAGLWDDPGPLHRAIEPAANLPDEPRDSIVHGDFYFRHLLINAAGSVGGVIDWGDVSLNEPCVDLQICWGFLPPAARPAFLAAYRPVSPGQRAKARALAVFLGAVLAVYGERERLPAVRDEALAGLRRCLAE